MRPGQAWMGAGTRLEQGPTPGPAPLDTSGVQGIDVSHWQGAINWGSVKAAGIDFAYMKVHRGHDTSRTPASARTTLAPTTRA